MRSSIKYAAIPFVLLALVGGIGVTEASAQVGSAWTERGFFNVSFGGQPTSRTVTIVDSFPLYDETATIESDITASVGGLFDIAGGYRFWKNVAAAVGYSRYSDTSSTTANASIPDPLFFDSPHSSSVEVSDLEHTESVVHLSAVYFVPVTDKIGVSVFAGPSFFSLNKDIPSDATIPPGGVTVTDIATRTISESATGGHFGVDLRYMITRQFGAGILLRYSSASVEVPEATIDMGGFNYAFGVRVAF